MWHRAGSTGSDHLVMGVMMVMVWPYIDIVRLTTIVVLTSHFKQTLLRILIEIFHFRWIYACKSTYTFMFFYFHKWLTGKVLRQLIETQVALVEGTLFWFRCFYRKYWLTDWPRYVATSTDPDVKSKIQYIFTISAVVILIKYKNIFQKNH